jgi:hypothetical protein
MRPELQHDAARVPHRLHATALAQVDERATGQQHGLVSLHLGDTFTQLCQEPLDTTCVGYHSRLASLAVT